MKICIISRSRRYLFSLLLVPILISQSAERIHSYPGNEIDTHCKLRIVNLRAARKDFTPPEQSCLITGDITASGFNPRKISWRAEIRNDERSIVKVFPRVGSRKITLTWDGHDDAGNFAGYDRYTCRITASCSEGVDTCAFVSLYVKPPLPSLVSISFNNTADSQDGTSDSEPTLYYMKKGRKSIGNPVSLHGTQVSIPPSGNALFFTAIEKGEIDKVRIALKENPEYIRSRDWRYWTPLHCAAQLDNPACAELLLSAGAEINAKDRENWLPIHFACEGAHTGVARLLIVQGTLINAPDTFGQTPLHLASWSNDIETVRLLVSKGANINAGDKDGLTPLHFVGSGRIAEYLISCGAQVNAKDNKGRTPLKTILLENRDRTAEVLRAHGGKI
ncbi:MAG: ankyrin repeat domain-containing protein [Vulcanimicrobiota bacterium]